LFKTPKKSALAAKGSEGASLKLMAMAFGGFLFLYFLGSPEGKRFLLENITFTCIWKIPAGQ
ncbi:hypothetical protein, partial [Ectobacillus ponti]